MLYRLYTVTVYKDWLQNSVHTSPYTSSSLTSTAKDTSIYFYIYFTFSTSIPTPATLQTSSNKTFCLKVNKTHSVLMCLYQ